MSFALEREKRVLVTGGAGYVGSLLVPALIENGHETIVLDWFLFEPNIFSDVRSARLKTIKGDIRDKDLVADCLKTVDTVIHLAGMSNDPSAILNPQVTKDINFTATVSLAKSAKEAGVKRMIIASSASVYGIQNSPAIEESTCHPLTVYSQTKLHSEQEILPLNDGDFTVVAVRPATLSGFAPRLRLDLVVNNMTSQATYYGELKIFGGDQYRPNLSVKDMVAVYLELMKHDSKVVGGQAYNVSESNLTISEIAEKIASELGDRSVSTMRSDSDDKRSYWVDASKISREIGFMPKYRVSDSIREIIEAIDGGIITDPSLPKFRNVQVLKSRDLSVIVKSK